jgi:hypothetical protein
MLKQKLTRRDFVKQTAAITCAVGALRAAEGLAADTESGHLPKIRLGAIEVSRLILGSNPFFGFHHGDPHGTDEQMRQYYTDERIMQVLDEAAQQGITAVWSPPYDKWTRLWDDYQQRGGKLRIWIGQPDYGDMKENITKCAKSGAKAVCIQGAIAGDAIREGKHELVKGWLEQIRGLGLPAGMASHYPEALLEAERRGLPAEWYHLTIGVPDTFTQSDREKSLETIANLDKPVVAFKVLGAGRFTPQDAFPHVLGKLRRKDGLCVGVFPAKDPDQLEENATLARQLTQARRIDVPAHAR